MAATFNGNHLHDHGLVASWRKFEKLCCNNHRYLFKVLKCDSIANYGYLHYMGFFEFEGHTHIDEVHKEARHKGWRVTLNEKKIIDECTLHI